MQSIQIFVPTKRTNDNQYFSTTRVVALGDVIRIDVAQPALAALADDVGAGTRTNNIEFGASTTTTIAVHFGVVSVALDNR